MPKSTLNQATAEVVPARHIEQRRRRILSPEYKLRIVQETKNCQRGELGKILRRERLYSAQVRQWQRDYAAHGIAGLSKSTPGPAPLKSADARRIEQLEKENARLSHKLETAQDCLELQKKLSSMLDRMNTGSSA